MNIVEAKARSGPGPVAIIPAQAVDEPGEYLIFRLDDPLVVWVCWKASQFDIEQVCRHEGCGWRVLLADFTEGTS